MPVVGFLGPTSLEVFADRIRGFQRGLKEMGYVEDENLTIAYRWAEGQFDRLPTLAGELVRRQVAAMCAVCATPSRADLDMTKQVAGVCKLLGIAVHDRRWELTCHDIEICAAR